MTRRKEQKN